MAWDKYDNVSSAGKWLNRKIELIEVKENLLIAQNNEKIIGNDVPIKTIYRSGIFHAELGMEISVVKRIKQDRL
jgi:hypothetical protein